MTRRSLLASLALGGLLAVLPAAAQEVTYFRIGTGAIGEAHFPIGGIIANALSNPPGARPCEKGGSCGVPGLIALAQSTPGAVDNIRAVADKRLEAALAQADVAYWAFHGTGPYQGKGAVSSLRAIAMLYSDSMHVVVRKDAGLKSLADLKGRRVSLGEAGSGTLVDARTILGAHGLRERDLKPSYLATANAAEQLARGEIDAFFVLDAAPVPSVAELAQSIEIGLLPVTHAEPDRLAQSNPFFSPGRIAAGSYPGVTEDVATLDVGVVLLVGAQVPHDLVYGITRALWRPATAKLLADGHPRGRLIRLATATERIGIPLHPGAAGYYFDVGLPN